MGVLISARAKAKARLSLDRAKRNITRGLCQLGLHRFTTGRLSGRAPYRIGFERCGRCGFETVVWDELRDGGNILKGGQPGSIADWY